MSKANSAEKLDDLLRDELKEELRSFNGLEIVEPTKTYDLKNLRQIHHEIIMLAMLGKKQQQIADALDISVQAVHYTLNSDIAKRKMDVLRAKRDEESLDVLSRLQELAPIALHEMERMLVHPDTGDNIKKDVAKDLLDRAGFGAVKKSANVNVQMTTKKISKFKEMARKQGILTSEVEETTAEDVTNIEDE